MSQLVMPWPENSVLLLCDMQKLFRPLLRNADKLLANQLFMVNCCKKLGIPIIVTEHVERVFGPTISDFNVDKMATKVIKKSQFSMCTNQVSDALMEMNRKNVIIIGMEAHICVLQTVLDLLKKGYNVHIPVDCVCSQRPLDEEIAFKRFESTDACLTTAQSIVFQLLRDAKHPKFKSLQKYIKKQSKL